MIPASIERIRERIFRRCQQVGRDPAEVTLVAVSKTFPPEMIREAISAGLRDIGENYVQEILGKRSQLAGEEVRWHFVGHLQRNKVRLIAPWIHLVHAVDDRECAQEIDKRAAQAGRTIDVLIEVNTTGEQTKFGIPPDRAAEFVGGLSELQHLRIAGLMTIGPFLEDPEDSRPMFRQLRQLQDEIARMGQRNVTARHLSMGMTGDFEVAIDEGSTLVRLGTAIFGSRTRRA